MKTSIIMPTYNDGPIVSLLFFKLKDCLNKEYKEEGSVRNGRSNPSTYASHLITSWKVLSQI